MERFSRQSQPAQSRPQPTAAPTPAPASAPAKKSSKHQPSLGSKLLVVTLIVAALVITAALAAGVWKSFNNTSQVNPDLYQAVFLDNGQVYFGKLSHLNSNYMQLVDVYYLQVDQQALPDQNDGATPQQQISLAKLGNELHGPKDRMFINPDQVIFWMNLRTDGQVTEAIIQHKNEPQGTDQPQSLDQ